ncbi:MAG: TIGR02147 family protein [Bdellovibrio sp.]
MKNITTLQGFITHRFEEARSRNPSYSLRAYAKTLGVSAASLSQILSGKRPLTLITAKKICDRLTLNPADEQRVMLSLLSENGIGGKSKEPSTAIIEVDRFKVISDWYHFAILSLTEIPKSKPDSKWIAQRLGISVSTAQEAVERLIRIGLIEIKGKCWRQNSLPLSVSSNVPSSAIRKYHNQILKKAAESLDKDPIENREFGAMTFAINPQKLPQAKAMIREFRKSLSQVLEDGPKARVYTLSVQLFPIDIEDK